jgi:voltage-gated potassium channel
LNRRKFHYVALVSMVVVSLGALGMYAVEHGRNTQIHSVGDAFWWSIVTATTVGYGDLSPTTTEGRLIAVVLMLVGIGFISILTATIASSFVEGDQRGAARDVEHLEERLARVEHKQDELLAAIRRQHQIL